MPRSSLSLLFAFAPVLVGMTWLTGCGSDTDPNALRFDQASTEANPADGDEAQSSLGGASDDEAGGPTCASSTLKAEGLPLRMVLVIDRSGSMCQLNDQDNGRNCADSKSRWLQAVSALTTFAASPESKGITADVIPFPAAGSADQCSDQSYQTPVAATVEFPDTAGNLGRQLKNATPNPNGQTPTEVAMDGASQYAERLARENAGKARVAIVIATDGEPQGCGDFGSIEPAAQHAARIRDRVPTYVIGVGGNRLAALDTLAASGGTSKAVLVDTSDPTKVSAKLGVALAQIRGSALGCQFKLPVSGDGKDADAKRVNVKITGADGKTKRLGYDEACAKGTGWRYDNPANPTEIELCTGACGEVKVDTKARIDVELGCATEVVK